MNQKISTVLVTGASGALGGVVTQEFLKRNWQVVAWDRVASTAKHPEGSSSVFPIACDVTDAVSVAQAWEETLKTVDGIQAVVHCAGGFRYSPLEQTSVDDVEVLINTNLKSAFFVLRPTVEYFKKKGFGRIVLISFRATQKPFPGVSAYAASKAGLNALTEVLAQEVLDYNITVNAVLPSVIDTPANRKDMPNADFTKWVKPEELANLILSLVSQGWGSAVSGSLISVGGRL